MRKKNKTKLFSPEWKKDLWRLDVRALAMKQFFNLLECLLPPSACLSGMQENKTWSQSFFFQLLELGNEKFPRNTTDRGT